MGGDLILLHGSRSPSVTDRLALWGAAAARQGVNLVEIDVMTHPPDLLPVPRPGDLLIGASIGTSLHEMLLWREGVRTFHRRGGGYITSSTNDVSALLQRAGVPAPRTVFGLGPDRGYLDAAVDYCGGFPVIAKVARGSLGVGVIRVDSRPALMSFVDFVVSRGEDFILRQYVPPAEVVRFIVLGEQVVSSTRKPLPPGDFRTAVAGGKPEERAYPEALRRMAVDASVASGWAFTGVDVLMDDQGAGYVLEVNMPHNFAVVERATGIPLAAMALEYLLHL